MTTQTINPTEITLSDEIEMKLYAIASKACKPGCLCSQNEGHQCDDRWMRYKLLATATRLIHARARGWQPDPSERFGETPEELALLVAGVAQVRKIESPNVRRLDILLRNGSARAVRIVRLWREDKMSFEQMLDAVSQHTGFHERGATTSPAKIIQFQQKEAE